MMKTPSTRPPRPIRRPFTALALLVVGPRALWAAGASLLSHSSFPSLTALEATSVAGDSGAPAFADFGSGPELVGMVSWGVNPTAPFNLYGSTYGDITYLTRISSSRDWILGVIPEPGASALAAGLAALGLMAARLSGGRAGPGTCGPCCPGEAAP